MLDMSSSPVAHERAEHHERVLHERHDLARRVPSEQELPARLEVAKGKLVPVPLGDHGLQLGLDVLLLGRRDADVLWEGKCKT